MCAVVFVSYVLYIFLNWKFPRGGSKFSRGRGDESLEGQVDICEGKKV